MMEEGLKGQRVLPAVAPNGFREEERGQPREILESDLVNVEGPGADRKFARELVEGLAS